jgi:hypothetical protein
MVLGALRVEMDRRAVTERALAFARSVVEHWLSELEYLGQEPRRLSEGAPPRFCGKKRGIGDVAAYSAAPQRHGQAARQ